MGGRGLQRHGSDENESRKIAAMPWAITDPGYFLSAVTGHVLTQIKVQTEYDRSMTGTTRFVKEKRLEKVCGVVSQPHSPIHSCCC